MITDVVGRVSELRIKLDQLSTPATSGKGFAASLNSALGASAGASAGAGVTGAAVVADAQRYLGVPYVFGGTDPKVGLDCSGLVQRVYKDLGISLPRIAADQARAGQPVAGLAQAKPGDLLAFGSPVDHIAIYIGNGQMIAAPQPGEKVKIQSVYATPTAIRRIIPDQVTGMAGLQQASLSGSGAVPYASMFQQAAARYGLPASLLAGVAKVESGFNPNAVSSAGARGLMQFMPGTAAEFGINPFDPAQAIDGAARLLSRNLREFGGSIPLALAAYNAGAGAVRQYGGIPPYSETRAYVPKVQDAMAALAAGGF